MKYFNSTETLSHFLDLPVTYLLAQKTKTLFELKLKEFINNLRYAEGIKKTKSLKGTENGPALVMANGIRLPDAIKQGFSRYPDISGAKKFCINHYILHSDLVGIYPDYYLLLDPLYFTDETELDEGLIAKAALDGECSIKDAEEDLRLCMKVRNNILDNPKIKLFVPYHSLGRFLNHKNVFGILGETNTASNNLFDVTRTLGWRPMTAYVAISIAMYLGHNPIYVAGFDNDSWKTVSWNRDVNKTFYYFRHFYPEGSLCERRSDICVHEMLSSASSIHRLQSRVKVVNLDPVGLF
jgi:hypothetical protein